MLQKEYGLTCFARFQFIERMKDQSRIESLHIKL